MAETAVELVSSHISAYTSDIETAFCYGRICCNASK